jgi:cell division protease FtsH
MEKKQKFNIYYILMAVWGVLILQNLIFGQFRPKVIPYSEFIDALDDDRVIEIDVGQDTITGRMKSGENNQEEIFFKTVRVDNDLSLKLSQHSVKFSGQVQNTFFRTILSWVLPIALFYVIWMFLMRRMQAGQASMLQLGKNKAKLVGENDVKTRFEDVAGADEAKEELKEIVDFLKDPQIYQEVGGRMPKGVLLVGPPGTGKTLVARAVAGEAGVPFFSLSGSDFVEMFVGMGAARVRDLFTQARDKAPCIIFIDELDAMGKARGAGAIGGHDEREQTLNQLLVEMDGFDTSQGVVIMAATNRPEVLDPALLRSGRFDRQILVDRPDVKGREAILKIHSRTIKLAEDVDLRVIAQKTPGFSGADLANIINEAALLSVRKGKKTVGMQELDEAVDRLIGGLEKKNRVINPKEKKTVAYHEVGHALVASMTPGADPVHKISIVPRGLAALGYTQQRPTEDRYLMSRKELLGKIDVLLGGRIAEKIIFGDVTTGAGNDLMRATDIARAMVAEYGMGETLGLSTYPRQRTPVFLPTQQAFGGGPEYSQETAARLDAEIKSILEQRERQVTELLTIHKDVLHSISKALLEKEVLYEDEFKAMLPTHMEKTTPA